MKQHYDQGWGDAAVSVWFSPETKTYWWSCIYGCAGYDAATEEDAFDQKAHHPCMGPDD